MFRSLLLLTVLVGLVVLPLQIVAAGPTPHQSSTTRKILVDSQDSVLRAELTRNGSKLLVDYGAFALWRVSDVQPTTWQSRPSVSSYDESELIGLRDGAIDTRTDTPTIPSKLRQVRTADAQFWMVQFVGPVKDAWLAELRGAGLELVMYMPINAYVVWGDAIALSKLDSLAAKSQVIQWNGAYHPAYRLAPALQRATVQRAATDLVDVTVQFYTTKAIDQSLARLHGLGGHIYQQPSQVLGLTNITLQLPAGQLIDVANWADVFNVEPWSAPEKRDEVQGQVIAGNLSSVGGKIVPSGTGYLAWLASKGFPTTPASYPVIDIVDDGVDQGNASNVLHPDFHESGLIGNPDRVAYIGDCTADPNGNGVGGHGNINAGIVGSYNNLSGLPHVDANGYHRDLGISPYGRIAGTKIFANSGGYDISQCGNTDQGVVAASYNAGATITSNSWGSDTAGAYDSSSQAYDALTRDASGTTVGNQQMLHIFAAGNAGAGANTVGSPGTAKNVLTVGATENVRDNGANDGCAEPNADNADDIASFSSRGPADDGRVKPDIMAPGTHIQGPASQDPGFDGSGVCGAATAPSKYYPAGQTLYTWSSGTSHSTPAVAGAASLVYEYYGRVLKPGQTPSPAMLKALLLNSPRYLNGIGTGGTLPSNDQGWGDVNLGTLFDNTTARVLLDQSSVFGATGEQYLQMGTIADSSKPLRISLVWTDAPGSTTGNNFVNNLDLEVTVGGNTYKGNVFSGANSTTGGSFDTRNNVENVFIPAGASGTFAVRVIARNIAGDAIPGNADSTDQDFALVISNGSAISGAALLSQSAVRWSDAAGNNNGIIDPGDTIALQLDLTNSGSATATSVSGVAAVTGGSATMTNASSSYADIAAGATKTNDADYVFTVSPSQACGSNITVEDTVSYAVGQTQIISATARVGAPGLGTLASSTYAGAAVPIPDPGTTTVTLNVPTSATVGDIDVRFSASHTYDSDLIIRLISPIGTTVTLSNKRGGSANNYTATTFDDEAATPISSGAAPFTGSFRPEQPLSAFDGQAVNGDWKLQVVDLEAPDTGSISQFQLDIRPLIYTCAAVTVNPISGLAASNNGPTGLGSPTILSTSVTGGTNITYVWSFGDGTIGAGVAPSHTYATIGSYTATVTATNSLGSATASTTVQVRDVAITGLAAGNDGPTVLGSPTALAATITGGTNVAYAWNFGDGTTGTGASPTHTYSAPGSYTATVTATNSLGSATASTTVQVQDAAITGLAASNMSPKTAGSPVSLTASITGGTNVAYAWNFGDGTTGTGASPTHTYSAPGSYTATVTATNSLGSSTASTTVIVRGAVFLPIIVR